MEFIGREIEIQELREIQRNSAKNATFVSVSGRRRVGKTTMIKEALEGQGIPYVYFFITKKSEPLICADFRMTVQASLGEDIGQFTSFSESLRQILNISKRINFTLVLDEIQNMNKVNSAFFSEFQGIWDDYKAESKINLVACGSLLTQMNNIFKKESGPLYGRTTNDFLVQPFKCDIIKTIMEKYNPSYTSDDLLAFYLVTGGVAKYMELLVDAGHLSKSSIIDHIFASGSYFTREGFALLEEEFGNDYQTYFSIMQCIAEGKTKRSEITSTLAKETGGFLKNLEEDFKLISKTKPFGKTSKARDAIFSIKDNFLNLWFRFFFKYQSLIEAERMSNIKEIFNNEFNAYAGRILEKWYRQCFMEQTPYYNVGKYWTSGKDGNYDIDVVAEGSGTIVFGEVKMNEEKFSDQILKDRSFNLLLQYKGDKVRYVSLPLSAISEDLNSLIEKQPVQTAKSLIKQIASAKGISNWDAE